MSRHIKDSAGAPPSRDDEVARLRALLASKRGRALLLFGAEPTPGTDPDTLPGAEAMLAEAAEAGDYDASIALLTHLARQSTGGPAADWCAGQIRAALNGRPGVLRIAPRRGKPPKRTATQQRMIDAQLLETFLVLDHVEDMLAGLLVQSPKVKGGPTRRDRMIDGTAEWHRTSPAKVEHALKRCRKLLGIGRPGQ